MADQVVQCGACRVDVRVVPTDVGDVVRCPACARTAPKAEAIQMARSAVIDVVMRDLPEGLRQTIRSNAALGYRAADHYDWVLRQSGRGAENLAPPGPASPARGQAPTSSG